MATDLQDTYRQLDVVVPDGHKNRRGMRVWREVIENIVKSLTDAAQGISDASGAQFTADTGVSDAATAQTAADAAASDAATVATGLTMHAGLAATTGAIGHVKKAGTITALTTAAAGPAPGLYSAAHSQALNDRIEDLVTQIADLNAKLQAAGVVS